ncbi:MAG: DUF2905 domain-containing protein [Nitrospinaceae bacterium]
MTQRILITLGILLVLAGILWPWIAKLGWGRLPGDIVIRRENFQFYLPITTCILISVFLTLLFWFFRK